MSEETPASSSDIVRDPECHILTGADGSMYTLTNMWTRNASFDNGLGEGNAYSGRAAAGLAVTAKHLIMPVFRTDYNNDPQTFRVFDRSTGKEVGAIAMDEFGTDYTKLWNKRRFEEAGNDDAGNCWIGSAFNVCDKINTTPFKDPPKDYLYYSEVLNDKDLQYLLVEVVDFSNIKKLEVRRRIKLILPKEFKSDKYDKYIVSGIHVRGDLLGANFEIYAGAYQFYIPPDCYPLEMLKWAATDIAQDRTLVTIEKAAIYSDDKLLGQNAQFHFIDDSHFLLNSTDFSFGGTNEETTLIAHPAMCLAGNDNGYPFVEHIASYNIDEATTKELWAESKDMRDHGAPYTQRAQTGSAIHAFKVGGNTFMVYNYTMQPRLQLAVRSLTVPTADATDDITAGSPVLFPSSPWPNIYLSVVPVGIGAIRTASDANGTDMYLYMPPSTLARYRISPVRPTSAAALPGNDTTMTITLNGNTLRLTGTVTIPGTRLSITDIYGRTLHSVPTAHTLDISTLTPGLYIAHAPGTAPLKFIVH